MNPGIQSVARAFLAVGATLLVACSSSSTGTSDTTGTQLACILPGSCLLTTGLTPQTFATVQADCTKGKGTPAASCPTTGLTACCIFLAAGSSSEIVCAYGDSGAQGDPTATKMCNQ